MENFYIEVGKNCLGAHHRTEVLRKAKKFIFKYLSVSKDAEVISALVEIVKNIYDHSDGGEISLHNMKENGHESILFESHCFQPATPKPKGLHNFGLGLQIIKDVQAAFPNKLKIISNKDFSYHIFYSKF